LAADTFTKIFWNSPAGVAIDPVLKLPSFRADTGVGRAPGVTDAERLDVPSAADTSPLFITDALEMDKRRLGSAALAERGRDILI
jgi:hypothetical protein